MRGFTSGVFVAGLLVPSLASVVPWIGRREVGLKVELTQLVASSINAVMTNTGSEPLKLLDYETLMDKNPVQKLSVVKDGVEVAFRGMHPRYKMSDFVEDAFTTLAPDESFTSEIDLAVLRDITGGEYDVSAVGAIPYAALDSTELAGSIPYASNILSLTVRPEQVEPVPTSSPVLDKRIVSTECEGAEGLEVLQALAELVNLAQIAATAAREGEEAIFEKFFKTLDPAIRAAVAARFDAISREAAATNGITTYYCQDPNDYCLSDTLAYTLPSENVVVNCPLFYTLSPLSRVCGDQDQTTAILHELLHAPAVLTPAAQDFALGLEASMQLDPQQAFLNSDTYALFANAVLNDCE